MSDINWDLAPHGAIELVRNGFRITYRDAAGNVYLYTGWEYSESWDLAEIIATRPQPEQPRKTVEDAVEHYGVWMDTYHTKLAFNGSMGWIYYSKDEDLEKSDIHVCTREEFEACVAAKGKSEPEWTHIYMEEKAYIKVSEPDCDGYILVVTEGAGYNLARLDELKPIKPTITKAEHEFLCKFTADVNDARVTSLVEDYLAERKMTD
jgi:hypothetical protein